MFKNICKKNYYNVITFIFQNKMLQSLALLLLAGCTLAQQTAKTSVAPRLQECYQEPTLLNRNNLPPMTMPVLIDIIQSIEDNANVNLDLRQLSALLLHT